VCGTYLGGPHPGAHPAGRQNDISPYTDMTMTGTELRGTLFHGLSDRSRLGILEALVEGERRVGDIVVATGLTQSNASTHLACLWDCGLVARERRGREVYYRLIDGVAELLAASDVILAQAGDTVGACPRYGCRHEQAA
jgi:DNA-binding transcriptional ArsR family regulator